MARQSRALRTGPTDENGGAEAPPYVRLDRYRAQDFGGFFRRSGVDVEPAPPLEAGDLRQLRDDLHMPVVELSRHFRERRAVDDQVERGRLERAVHALQRLLQHPRQRLILVTRRLLVVGAMA